MSFILQLNFKGLLHYVENGDISKNGRLCIVLPKAAGHTGTISTETGTELRGADPDGIAIDGQRVVLQFTTTTPRTFDFENQVIGGSRRLKGAIPLDTIIGNSADQNPDIVAAAPSSFSIRSQFLMTEGGEFHLVPAPILSATLNSPPNSLNGNVSTDIDFPDQFYMEVPNVSSAKIIVFPLTASITPRVEYEIITTQPTASLTLAHVCFNPGVIRQPGEKDHDFRFHYYLHLRQRSWICRFHLL